MELAKYFYDPKTGFRNTTQLSKDLNITKQAATDFYKAQTVNQVFKPRLQSKTFKIVGEPNSWQADIMFYSDLSRKNKNNIGCLNVINIHTKYAYSIPLKTKTLGEVTKAFEKIDKPIDYLTTDGGKEFDNTLMKKFTEQHNIKHTLSQRADKTTMGVVERFNRTLRGLLDKHMTVHNTAVWYDVLDDYILNYNTRIHSTTGVKPIDMTPENEENLIELYRQHNRQLQQSIDIQPGDKVRVLLSAIEPNIFKKGGQNYTTEIYTVKEQVGYSFVLYNPTGNTMRRRFKHWQLQKLTHSIAPDDVAQNVKRSSLVTLQLVKSSNLTQTNQRQDERKAHLKNQRRKREGIESNNIKTTKRRPV